MIGSKEEKVTSGDNTSGHNIRSQDPETVCRGRSETIESRKRQSMMELYIHIPFCVRKCKYCDFLSMPADWTTMERYVEALCREIRYYGATGQSYAADGSAVVDARREVSGELSGSMSGKQSCRSFCGQQRGNGQTEISTVYFGGGTPSVIGADNLNKILDCIRGNFAVRPDAEITVEINPATIDRDGLQKLYENGVNRLSIGLQSTDDRELKLLGRIHNYEEFLDTFAAARAVGFKNLNVDLISSLPGQTVADYLESLEKLIALKPEHISAYSLILEEGTPFYETYAAHPELLPDEETDREMYHQTKVKLRETGYERYEISNYAKPGFESKHNSGYWKRVPYLGIGLGASSFANHARWRNISDLKEYLQIWGDERSRKTGAEATAAEVGRVPNAMSAKRVTETVTAEEAEFLYEEYDVLSPQDEMSEYLYLGLRMSEGVSISGFEESFGQKLSDLYGGQLEKLQRDGLLVIDEAEDRIFLTDYGTDVSNYVFEKFI